MKTIFTNALILRGNGHSQSQSDPVLGCMVIEDDKIAYIGSEDDESVANAKQVPGVQIVDLQRRTVIPGFIDGYVLHLPKDMTCDNASLATLRSAS
jgi:predicted amidohydrolase YtcJ